jgi:hypothetical protein
MKRILLFLSALFITTTAIAHTINWYVNGNIFHTTTCESGENVTPPTAPEKYGYTFKGWDVKYTAVEYLESTGTQWIDTGVSAPNGYIVKIQLMGVQKGRFAVFGSHNTSAPYGRNDILISNSGNLFEIGADQVIVTSAQYSIDTKYNVIYSSIKNNVYFSIEEPRYYERYDNATYLSANNLYLFHINKYDSFKPFIGRVYSCQIYVDAVLVRDLIPVIDSDGIPCMYDKVEHKFYYNAGTGDFIAGPTVGE